MLYIYIKIKVLLMKAISTDDFKVTGAISILNSPTEIEMHASDDEMAEALEGIGEEISKLQDKMYANNRYSVLVILQGV
jgi:polyphosphate kinase 2 (PPK2 family)